MCKVSEGICVAVSYEGVLKMAYNRTLFSAIDKAFDQQGVERTLKDANDRAVSIKDLEMNLERLGECLPQGSNKAGGTFNISFDKIFKQLSKDDQAEVWKYYAEKVKGLDSKLVGK